jgi:hypothetical protein
VVAREHPVRACNTNIVNYIFPPRKYVNNYDVVQNDLEEEILMDPLLECQAGRTSSARVLRVFRHRPFSCHHLLLLAWKKKKKKSTPSQKEAAK